MSNPPVLSNYSSTQTDPAGSILGVTFLSIAIFFLIVFASNAILSPATLPTLGIIATLSLLSFMGIILLILFAL